MSAEEYLTEKFKDHPLTIKWPEQLPKIMECYAREHHAKEMERKLVELSKEIDNLYPSSGMHEFYNAGFEEGAKWLLNHLKEEAERELEKKII